MLPGESTSLIFLLLVTVLVMVAEGALQDRAVLYLYGQRAKEKERARYGKDGRARYGEYGVW
jgi:hypothetical protein